MRGDNSLVTLLLRIFIPTVVTRIYPLLVVHSVYQRGLYSALPMTLFDLDDPILNRLAQQITRA